MCIRDSCYPALWPKSDCVRDNVRSLARATNHRIAEQMTMGVSDIPKRNDDPIEAASESTGTDCEPSAAILNDSIIANTVPAHPSRIPQTTTNAATVFTAVHRRMIFALVLPVPSLLVSSVLIILLLPF